MSKPTFCNKRNYWRTRGGSFINREQCYCLTRGQIRRGQEEISPAQVPALGVSAGGGMRRCHPQGQGGLRGATFTSPSVGGAFGRAKSRYGVAAFDWGWGGQGCWPPRTSCAGASQPQSRPRFSRRKQPPALAHGASLGNP